MGESLNVYRHCAEQIRSEISKRLADSQLSMFQYSE
jgi:hypothetical protein